MTMNKLRIFLWPLAVILVLSPLGAARAHEARPLFIEVKERAPNVFLASWKIPPTVKRGNAPQIELPASCRPGRNSNPTGAIQSVLFRCDGDLGGDELTIRYPAFNPSISTVVRFERLNGETHSTVLGPDVTAWTIPELETKTGVASKFFALGVKHILTGWDHLLFVAGLIFIAGAWRRILTAVTGFTVAHSITLAGAALGLVRVPVPPIEAAIALSIVFLAWEIVRNDRTTITWRWPVAISFFFGLVHGFGFASVLSSIGLPQLEVPLALLFFNLGVEAGQLLFIAVLIAVTFGVSRLLSYQIFQTPLARTSVAYGIGSVGMFWVVQRVAGFSL
jgi:hydrogenase/urease accessory protein HupE